MPNSPASTSRRTASPGASHSNTKTRRSTVSAAFNTRGPSATAPTQTSSAVVYAKSGSPGERSQARSVSGKASSPGSTAQRASVVTVGTVTDPDATASELLATKTPQIMTGGGSMSIAKSPSVSMTSKMPSAAGARNASVAPEQSVSAQGTSSLAGGGGGSTKAGQASVSQRSVKSPPAAADQASTVPGSSMVDGQASSMADAQPVGHGIIDVTVRTGAKIELGISLVGCALFAWLWIHVLTAKCYRDNTFVFLTTVFSGAGLVACIFIGFHSCFERSFTMGRGIMGCTIFFAIAVIVFGNLVDAFRTMSCICKCSATAFAGSASADVTIFVLSILGSLALIAILLVSSVVHEDHHNHPNHNKRAQVIV